MKTWLCNIEEIVYDRNIGLSIVERNLTVVKYVGSTNFKRHMLIHTANNAKVNTCTITFVPCFPSEKLCIGFVCRRCSSFLFRPFYSGGARWLSGRVSEREVRGSRPTSAVLCPWARHFTPRKYWLITQEAMAPSRHDWKIVDWDVKPQHNQPTFLFYIWQIALMAT